MRTAFREKMKGFICSMIIVILVANDVNSLTCHLGSGSKIKTIQCSENSLNYCSVNIVNFFYPSINKVISN